MKTTILLFTICAFTIGCNDNSIQNNTHEQFNKKDKIGTFWNWFVENKQTFEKTDSTNSSDNLNLILSNIHDIETGLSVEISKETDGIRELTISPEGDKEKFQIVKDIVSKAPQIQGWTIVAFRQPVNFDFTLEYKDLKLTPSEMFFSPIITGDTLDVIVYANNISNYDENTVGKYGLIAMDNLLGEYDCVTKVRYYDFLDLDTMKDKSQIKPLTELKSFIDNFHKVRKK